MEEEAKLNLEKRKLEIEEKLIKIRASKRVAPQSIAPAGIVTPPGVAPPVLDTPPPVAPSPTLQTEAIDIQEGITKKQAAIEVHKQLNSNKITSLMAVIGFLVVAGASTVKAMYGSIAALVFCVAILVMLATTLRDMKRLEITYQINPKSLK